MDCLSLAGVWLDSLLRVVAHCFFLLRCFRWHRVERDFARLRGFVAVAIDNVLYELAFQHKVTTLARRVPRAAFDAALEFKPHAVNGSCAKLQLITVQDPICNEVVERRAAIALQFSVPRNESGDLLVSARVIRLNRELQDFTLMQEFIFAGERSRVRSSG